jgi:gamma-glutamyltranspeptidase / glutathione hydrolase
MNSPQARSTRAPNGMVASADQLATQAGLRAMHLGGNAVDAAIAANAAMAVVGPHLCGVGGDLFALVHHGGQVHALNATGRAGSGADAAALRAGGHATMPLRGDVRAVTAPGCVDGWAALHERFGSLPLADLLRPAIALAADGFPASPLLAGAASALAGDAAAQLHELASQATRPGARVRRPGLARALREIGESGRDAFYGGEFGAGLRAVGHGLFSEADITAAHADWVTPLSLQAFGVDLHTMPPNSQGYLSLGSAWLADQCGALPADPDDPQWAHILIEASTAAGHDRPDVLHDSADGELLLTGIRSRTAMVDLRRASQRPSPLSSGDTTYLCAVDSSGTAVSLIQSNASGFGSGLVEPNTQINLHNRGLGFSLVPGHPAEFAPGRRPPHTLSPALATRNGSLAAVFGSMGGDAQPQIVLQLATRMFRHSQSPARAVRAARFVLAGESSGFDTWTSGHPPSVAVEGHAPAEWAEALSAKGHHVVRLPAFDSSFGHAHAIVVDDDGFFAGHADPRTVVGGAAGI